MVTNAGFTLIELVFILVIISILAVLPLFNWPGTVINLDAQSRLLADDLRYAQSLAMAKTERYRFVYTSSTTYQIQNSTGAAILFASGATTQTLNKDLTLGVTSTLPNNLVVFDGKGSPYSSTGSSGTALVAGSTYSFTVTDGTTIKNIVITPITGRIVIQ